MYPFIFKPLPKARVWGGRALSTRKGFLEKEPVGESWEICDYAADVSVIANGSMAGQSLREVFRANTAALVGRGLDLASPERFPLMLKLLDAQDVLSVQVHPDDAYAGRQKAGELGKTEAWYILEAAPGAFIYHGLRTGVDRAAIERHVAAGTLEECLVKVTVTPGDVYHIPSGMVHALGSGVRMAEIQQNSDTTYRLYDWNRRGLDGKPRALHVDDSLAVIDFAAAGGQAQAATRLSTAGACHERFIRCDKFVFERLRAFVGPVSLNTGGDSFHIISMAAGTAAVSANGVTAELGAWECCLVPAACGAYRIAAGASAEALVFHVPAR